LRPESDVEHGIAGVHFGSEATVPLDRPLAAVLRNRLLDARAMTPEPAVIVRCTFDTKSQVR
jgi:hypothetical protein